MNQSIGVVAIQGDFEKHIESFHRAGVSQVSEVRTPEELAGIDRLVIPGGESTTVGKLMDRFGLGVAIQERAKKGMPVWGTCMGLILMAREVQGHEQYTLGLLDVSVKRNAFGAQAHSFEDNIDFEGLVEPITGVFIRAPVVTNLGPDVILLAHYNDEIVGVRQGNCMGTSFHPELTDDVRIHEIFLKL